MPKTQAQKEAQKRYEAKNPKFSYKVNKDFLFEIEALRGDFETDQAMMEYLITLGLKAHKSNKK
jgi:hypothetical protein